MIKVATFMHFYALDVDFRIKLNQIRNKVLIKFETSPKHSQVQLHGNNIYFKRNSYELNAPSSQTPKHKQTSLTNTLLNTLMAEN
jgi:hypothetical protein